MKKKILSVCFSLLNLFSIATLAQGPGEPYSPMTAPGAEGISTGQIHHLRWKNPIGVLYNEVYLSEDSLSVYNLNASARILNGYPNTVYDDVIPNYPYYEYFKRFFWRIVEHDSSGATFGPIWYYRTNVWPGESFEEHFDSLDNWIVVGPNGFNNWILGTSYFIFPELQFNWTPTFIGESYIKYYKVLPGGYETNISFDCFVDWYSDTITVGLAIKNIKENSWSSIWEKQVTNNFGPQIIYLNNISDEVFYLGFYFTGNSFNIDGWYIDNVIFSHPIETFNPPGFLHVSEDSINQLVELSWTQGYAPSPSLGYRIKRKIGLPTDTSEYSIIGYTCNDSLSFIDIDVQANEIYTYKVQTIYPCPINYASSISGNEATAYLQNIVPIELQSFNAEVINNNVSLDWSTATETNNSGFGILRFTQNDKWDNIGFVPGHGTTTETQHYSFTDKEVKPGKYQYRLEQIDFDGTFEYSNTIEITIEAPSKFALEQNYPNPFNPSTKIKYTIPSNANGEMSNVSLLVYDILGNEVEMLVNEQKLAGTYEAEFDGSILPSGIYFYQLKSGSYIETKKMVLLK